MIKSVQRILTVTPEDPTYIMTMKNVMLEDYKARARKDLSHKSLALFTARDPRFKKLNVLPNRTQRELVLQRVRVANEKSTNQGAAESC